jgi:hypothetical protein
MPTQRIGHSLPRRTRRWGWAVKPVRSGLAGLAARLARWGSTGGRGREPACRVLPGRCRRARIRVETIRLGQRALAGVLARWPDSWRRLRGLACLVSVQPKPTIQECAQLGVVLGHVSGSCVGSSSRCFPLSDAGSHRTCVVMSAMSRPDTWTARRPVPGLVPSCPGGR